MANAYFILKNPKAKIPQPIYLRFWVAPSTDIKFPVKISVNPKFWDAEKCRVKNVVSVTDRQRINEYLNELEKAVESYKVQRITNKETLTVKGLREYLTEYTTPTNPKEKTLFGFAEMYIEQAKTKINPQTGKRISEHSIYKLNDTVNRLKDFEAGYKRKIDFDTIDLDFYADFTAYLSGAGLSVNSIGTLIKRLKTILNGATERGLNTYTAYKSKRFATVSEDSDSIYLTEAELQSIYKLDLSNNPKLDRVRDLFLLGAYTGLRFSDFIRLTSDNIQNGKISIHQTKTGAKVIIPLHTIVKAILKRNGGTAPPAISNQKMNDYLKQIGQLAKLNEKVSKTITKGGQQITVNRPKWQMLSTHTARRTFATNQFLSGFPAQSIMKITGHHTETSFMKYIKVSQEQNADLLALHWQKNRKLQIA